jgi:acetoin utilization transport system permease protein
MKKNKMRLFMTILATTIGCAFLIVLASVGFGLHKSIKDQILDQVVVTEIDLLGKEIDKGFQTPDEKDIQEVKQMKNVKAVVTRNSIHREVDASIEDRSTNISPIFTNMEEVEKVKINLSEGRLPKNENEVVVGYHFGKSLYTEAEKQQMENLDPNDPQYENKKPKGYTGDLIGKTVNMTIKQTVDGKEVEKSFDFTIVGIQEEPSRDWIEDKSFIVSDKKYKEVKQFTDLAATEEEKSAPLYDEVKVYATSLEHVQAVTDELKEKGYRVFSVTEELESLNLFFLVLKIGLIFVGTIAVLIASIGIFNTMTMAVTERTQEIGIMKAIGAQPSMIRRTFLMESAWIGIVGALLGVVISYGVSALCNQIIPMILNSISDSEGPSDFIFSYIPPSLVLIATLISIGVAVISGLRPAIKATNINVLSALRREI